MRVDYCSIYSGQSQVKSAQVSQVKSIKSSRASQARRVGGSTDFEFFRHVIQFTPPCPPPYRSQAAFRSSSHITFFCFWDAVDRELFLLACHQHVILHTFVRTAVLTVHVCIRGAIGARSQVGSELNSTQLNPT